MGAGLGLGNSALCRPRFAGASHAHARPQLYHATDRPRSPHRHWGCVADDCQLCRNNASKVCDDASVFDAQYWVRDDGKGGQPLRARCGAPVAVQAVDRATGLPVALPADVQIRVSGACGRGGGEEGDKEEDGGRGEGESGLGILCLTLN